MDKELVSRKIWPVLEKMISIFSNYEDAQEIVKNEDFHIEMEKLLEFHDEYSSNWDFVERLKMVEFIFKHLDQIASQFSFLQNLKRWVQNPFSDAELDITEKTLSLKLDSPIQFAIAGLGAKDEIEKKAILDKAELDFRFFVDSYLEYNLDRFNQTKKTQRYIREQIARQEHKVKRNLQSINEAFQNIIDGKDNIWT